MADDSTKPNVISDLVGLLTSLRKKSEPTGVDNTHGGSVVKDTSEAVNSNFVTGEEIKLKKVFELLGKTLELGKYADTVTAKKLEDLTPGAIKDKVAGVEQVSTKKKEEEAKPDFLTTILKALGALAIGALGFSLLPEDVQKNIKDIVSTIYNKVTGAIKDVFKDLLTEENKEKFKTIATIIGGAVVGLLVTIVAFDLAIDGLAVAFLALGGGLLAAAGGLAVFDLAIAGIGIGLGVIAAAIIISINKFSDALVKLSKEGLQAFSEIDVNGIEEASVALMTLGGAFAALGLLIAPIAIGAGALYLISKAFGVFVDVAKLAIPVFNGTIESLNKLKDIPIDNIKAIGPALISIGEGLAIFGAGNFIDNILSGLGSLFGAKSPFDKIIKLSKAAPGMKVISESLQGISQYSNIKLFGDLDVTTIVKSIDSINGALWNLLGTQEKIQKSTFFNSFNNVFDTVLKTINETLKLQGNIQTNLKSISSNDEPMKALITDTSEYNKFAKSAMVEQIKRQDTMIDLLVQLVRKPGGSTVINNTGGGNNTSPNNFRDNFVSQTLVTN